MLRLSRGVFKKATLRRAFCSSFDRHNDNFLTGENAVYAEQMLQRWTQDRSSVHSSWDAYFTNLSNGLESAQSFAQAPASHQAGGAKAAAKAQPQTQESGNVLQEKLSNLIYRYRRKIHEIAQIDPLAIEENKIQCGNKFELLEENPKKYGFSESELANPIDFIARMKGFHNEKKRWSPLEVSKLLQEIYAGHIGFEYMHIPNIEVQDWIRERVEKVPAFSYTKPQKEYLLDRILESQAFTDFCDKKYSSSKRFGIDGLDSVISGLEMLVDSAKDHGVTQVVLGMAHRGRLNTLACVFDKPYEAIFTEFKDPGITSNLKSAEWGFAGDVKYHLGATNKRMYPDGSKINLVG